MAVVIYHNPRCRKSREALELLREHGVEPEIIDYLTTPFTRERLSEILDLLGMEPREILRKQEKIYKELGLGDPSLTRDRLIEAMVHHPKLVERPIVVAGQRAVLGRPREKVLDLL